MKYVLVCMLLTAAIFTNAQKALVFSEVVQVDSATKDELYSRAKHWFAAFSADKKATLQLSDKEDGELVGKCTVAFASSYPSNNASVKGSISYTVSIYCKEGRFKYEITNFNHEGSSGINEWGFTYEAMPFGLITTDATCPKGVQDSYADKWRNGVWNELKVVAQSEAEALAAALKETMKQPATTSGNW